MSVSKNIELKMMNVQLQNGRCDCGLFIIAFQCATALANTNSVWKLLFQTGPNKETSIQMLNGREHDHVSTEAKADE